MEFPIKPRENLFINEWNLLVDNQTDHAIKVDLGHTELLVKTIAISEKADA